MLRVPRSPTRCQVRPPSRLLKTPSPAFWLLRGLPSPVPTQMTSGLSWSMATEPMEWTG